MKPKTKLHIISLNWQGKSQILDCKNSLIPALEGIDYTWHIKDNGSTDGSLEEIRNWNDINVNLMAYPNNRQSYAEGMNLLYKECAAQPQDIILTLNNDIVIKDASSIKHMMKIIDTDKDVGVVGAKLNYTNTDKIQHAGVLFSTNRGLPYHYRAGVSEAPRDRSNRYYPVVTGAVAMLKADTYANIYTKNKSGNVGFCEDYIFAFEDVDMCLRAEHNLKKKNVYCGQTEIFHEESATLKKNPIHKMFFNQNCKTFLNYWYKYLDQTLTLQYDKSENHNLYKS